MRLVLDCFSPLHAGGRFSLLPAAQPAECGDSMDATAPAAWFLKLGIVVPTTSSKAVKVMRASLIECSVGWDRRISCRMSPFVIVQGLHSGDLKAFGTTDTAPSHLRAVATPVMISW